MIAILLLPGRLFLPVNLYVPVILLISMSVSSVINHQDIEIYPKWFSRNFPGKSIIGATHHALHHKQYKYNFGLYFTWWDRIAKTESPVYEELLEEKTKKNPIYATGPCKQRWMMLCHSIPK